MLKMTTKNINYIKFVIMAACYYLKLFSTK